MPRGGPSSKKVMLMADKYDVRKTLLDDTDILPVMKAIQDVTANASSIVDALQVKQNEITKIQRLHQNNPDLLAVSLMGTWLRGNCMKDKKPYILHEDKKFQVPSWWNLVWAVEYSVGGNNPAHAEVIGKHYKGYENPTAESTAYDSAPTDPLKDTDAVLDKMEDVWHKWYMIGVALNRPIYSLDQITSRQLPIVRDSFKAMIDGWLQAGALVDENEKPCWKQLLIAVDASYGGANPAFATSVLGGLNPGITGGNASAVTPSAVLEKKKTDNGASIKNESKIADDGVLDIPQKIKDHFLPYTINKRDTEKHGLALVIINQDFQQHPDHPTIKPLPKRDCASLDRDRLQDLLRKLHYRVRIEEDQTAKEIKSLLREVRVQGDPNKTIQPGDDSFVCCISSHGGWDPVLNTDVVFGVRGVQTEEDDRVVLKGAVDIKAFAYETLSPLEDGCPALKGRPKMFFIQACRGGEYGRVVADDAPGGTKAGYKPAKYLPREADFLFAYATAPGTKAFRNEMSGATTKDKNLDGLLYGSFFISCLHTNLTAYARKLPLLPVLECISQELAAEEKYAHDKGEGRVRQSPNFLSSLRGPVFFFNQARKRYKRKMLSGL